MKLMKQLLTMFISETATRKVEIVNRRIRPHYYFYIFPELTLHWARWQGGHSGADRVFIAEVDVYERKVVARWLRWGYTFGYEVSNAVEKQPE